MNVVPARGERRIAVKTGGGETLLVIRAGVYTSLFWFVGAGNACVFKSGSPVEKATEIFCEARQTLEMKRALTTAAEAVFDSTELRGNLLLDSASDAVCCRKWSERANTDLLQSDCLNLL